MFQHDRAIDLDYSEEEKKKNVRWDVCSGIANTFNIGDVNAS